MSNQTKQRGKKLSPWTILTIMHRAACGEQVTSLASEFGINKATINRWLLKWSSEIEIVEQMQAGRLALRATAQMAKRRAS